MGKISVAENPRPQVIYTSEKSHFTHTGFAGLAPPINRCWLTPKPLSWNLHALG